ncbi:MAG: inositol monophosphatase [Clostridia bacterium]|nr:inositol monophosphatase [Clostridia bacterium]
MDYNEVLKLVKETKSIIFNRDSFDVNLKGKLDFVTNIDIAVSNYLKTELKKLAPNVEFFCEEEKGALSDNCWILDPIDGTTNLVYDYRMSAVSLAHYKNGEVLFGAVYNPFTDEMFSAIKGEGAWYNCEQKISVSKREMKDALIEFGINCVHKETADKNFQIAKEIFKNCVDIRRVSSAALDLCYISIGRLDGYFENILKPWDIAAGSLILTEAGGVITDYEGNAVNLSEPTSVIAGNCKVHPKLKEIVNKY